jgi:teichuronic acid biosynthesis glycosyltransferase TuaG
VDLAEVVMAARDLPWQREITNPDSLDSRRNSPLVSIITPCFNAARFLPDTIRAVLNQTCGAWEWIVTDDCSADDSRALLSLAADSRIRVISHEQNRGAAAAYNTSLSQAQGRFITFLDADDVWDPTFLEEMCGYLQSTGAELAYCGYRRCDENMQPVLRDFRATKDVTFRNMLVTCRLSTLSAVYDSKRIGKVLFPIDSKREDHAMWLSVLREIPVGRAVDKVLAAYRIHDTSRSANKLAMIRPQYEVYRRFLRYGVARSAYYTSAWALNGALKYAR